MPTPVRLARLPAVHRPQPQDCQGAAARQFTFPVLAAYSGGRDFEASSLLLVA
jgi:hypothetical protein